MLSFLLCSSLLGGALPANLAASAQAAASSATGGKYAPQSALDGDPQTQWATSANAQLPQTLTLTWVQPQRFDTVVVTGAWRANPTLYSTWSSFEVEAGGQVVKAAVDDPTQEAQFVHFAQPIEAG